MSRNLPAAGVAQVNCKQPRVKNLRIYHTTRGDVRNGWNEKFPAPWFVLEETSP